LNFLTSLSGHKLHGLPLQFLVLRGNGEFTPTIGIAAQLAARVGETGQDRRDFKKFLAQFT
jgi:hypothetical protein